jgi:hypothetical protein
MATKNLLTYNAKVSSVEQVYYAPVAVVPPQTDVPLSSLFCFLSKVDPWPDENDPEQPRQDQKYIKQVFKNMFVAKAMTSADISPVVKRVDWTTGVIYDHYQDNLDMFALNDDGSNVYNFYVKNQYDQVFKCLWNANDTPSTVEPYFEPGSYGTNNIYLGSDGYKWKYMYTVSIGDKVKFMNADWLPVPVGSNTPNPLTSSAGIGSIDVINILEGGSGYDEANAIITVSVTGDGTGASGTVEVTDGVITDVVMTSPGSNYTYATVDIVSSIGSGAVASANSSPIGGHGFDPVSELGTSHIMFAVDFNGSEGETIPTDITFHQLGIVINPTTKQLTTDGTYYPANGDIYKTTTDIVVAPGFGVYTNDEVVYQGDRNNPSFIGTVLTFDPASNVIRLINTTGAVTTNAPIYGKSSLTTRTLLTYSLPNFVIYSGYMSYIENRTGITRSPDGIEQFKFVLGY